jgi:protein ImuA
MHQDKTDTLALLREKIRRMEAVQPLSADRLPTGFVAIDTHLGGGLARGCVHDVLSAGRDKPFRLPISRLCRPCSGPHGRAGDLGE